jgi:hypothetical protein
MTSWFPTIAAGPSHGSISMRKITFVLFVDRVKLHLGNIKLEKFKAPTSSDVGMTAHHSHGRIYWEKDYFGLILGSSEASSKLRQPENSTATYLGTYLGVDNNLGW